MILTRDTDVGRWAGIFYSDMVGGYYYGIFAIVNVLIYLLSKRKEFAILAIFSVVFVVFSQARMYLVALGIAYSFLFIKNKYIFSLIVVMFLFFLNLIVYTEFAEFLIDLPGLGSTFLTSFQFIEAFQRGLFANALDFAQFNFQPNQSFTSLSTFSDRFYFANLLLINDFNLLGNGIATSTEILQKFINVNVDISHSDPITLIFEFGIIGFIGYYVFYFRLLNFHKLFSTKPFHIIIISICIFDFISGLTSSNLHLAIPRFVLFYGLLLLNNIAINNHKK